MSEQYEVEERKLPQPWDVNAVLRMGAAVMVGVVLAVLALGLSNRTQPAPIVIEPPPPTATAAPTPTPGPLRVFINGAVANPAVYELAPGSIVQDLVALAGGFAPGAYEDVVNLAQPLTDGMQVYVPTEAEREVGAVQPPPIVNALVAPSAETGAGSGSGLININTASKEALESLPGVGPATAQKIIDHRDANGLFSAIEGIMEVSGIGPAKFDGVRELITVDE